MAHLTNNEKHHQDEIVKRSKWALEELSETTHRQSVHVHIYFLCNHAAGTTFNWNGLDTRDANKNSYYVAVGDFSRSRNGVCRNSDKAFCPKAAPRCDPRDPLRLQNELRDAFKQCLTRRSTAKKVVSVIVFYNDVCHRGRDHIKVQIDLGQL